MLLKRFQTLVQYASDLHIERGFNRFIIPKKPYLLLAGDVGYPHTDSYKNFLLTVSGDFNKVFIIAGNHEYDKLSVAETDVVINDTCMMRNNLYYLQKDTHVLCADTRLQIAGCTLWSTYPKRRNQYHQDHVQWLDKTVREGKENSYVIATHHCPLPECVNPIIPQRIANYFVSDRSAILKQPNVVCWVHGHSHVNKKLFKYDKPILSNQYGNYKLPVKGYK
jgi:predicted phosphohydrolase